jgi:hypothetical protein
MAPFLETAELMKKAAHEAASYAGRAPGASRAGRSHPRHMSTPTGGLPADIPIVIPDYLAAHEARDTEAAVRAFSPGAVVVDDGSTYRGPDEIRGFESRAGSQFTYTTTLVGAERTEDGRWVVVNRLEGDFPGGAVDLRYRFTVDGDRITELVIAP